MQLWKLTPQQNEVLVKAYGWFGQITEEFPQGTTHDEILASRKSFEPLCNAGYLVNYPAADSYFLTPTGIDYVEQNRLADPDLIKVNRRVRSAFLEGEAEARRGNYREVEIMEELKSEGIDISVWHSIANYIHLIRGSGVV